MLNSTGPAPSVLAHHAQTSRAYDMEHPDVRVWWVQRRATSSARKAGTRGPRGQAARGGEQENVRSLAPRTSATTLAGLRLSAGAAARPRPLRRPGAFRRYGGGGGHGTGPAGLSQARYRYGPPVSSSQSRYSSTGRAEGAGGAETSEGVGDRGGICFRVVKLHVVTITVALEGRRHTKGGSWQPFVGRSLRSMMSPSCSARFLDPRSAAPATGRPRARRPSSAGGGGGVAAGPAQAPQARGPARGRRGHAQL